MAIQDRTTHLSAALWHKRAARYASQLYGGPRPRRCTECRTWPHRALSRSPVWSRTPAAGCRASWIWFAAPLRSQLAARAPRRVSFAHRASLAIGANARSRLRSLRTKHASVRFALRLFARQDYLVGTVVGRARVRLTRSPRRRAREMIPGFSGPTSLQFSIW